MMRMMIDSVCRLVFSSLTRCGRTLVIARLCRLLYFLFGSPYFFPPSFASLVVVEPILSFHLLLSSPIHLILPKITIPYPHLTMHNPQYSLYYILFFGLHVVCCVNPGSLLSFTFFFLLFYLASLYCRFSISFFTSHAAVAWFSAPFTLCIACYSTRSSGRSHEFIVRSDLLCAQISLSASCLFLSCLAFLSASLRTAFVSCCQCTVPRCSSLPLTRPS